MLDLQGLRLFGKAGQGVAGQAGPTRHTWLRPLGCALHVGLCNFHLGKGSVALKTWFTSPRGRGCPGPGRWERLQTTLLRGWEAEPSIQLEFSTKVVDEGKFQRLKGAEH